MMNLCGSMYGICMCNEFGDNRTESPAEGSGIIGLWDKDLDELLVQAIKDVIGLLYYIKKCKQLLAKPIIWRAYSFHIACQDVGQ